MMTGQRPDSACLTHRQGLGARPAARPGDPDPASSDLSRDTAARRDCGAGTGPDCGQGRAGRGSEGGADDGLERGRMTNLGRTRRGLDDWQQAGRVMSMGRAG
jgi:hypothetical protein